jgi:hypothetical protein
MTFRTRNFIIFLSLLALIGSAFSALTRAKSAPKNPSSLVKSQILERATLQVLKHEDGELLLKWECPEVTVDRDSLRGVIDGIDLAGATTVSRQGVPRLPELVQLLDALPGACSAELVDADIDSRNLGPMAASPADFFVDPPVENNAGTPPPPVLSWAERSQLTPLQNGLWPAQMVTLTESGVFRGHRILALHVFPVQVDAARGLARVARRIKIRVHLPRQSTAAANRLLDRPQESELVRRMLGPLASTALATRMPEAFTTSSRIATGTLDENTGEAIGGRWKLIVRERCVVRVTAAELRAAGCPVEQITAFDTHIRNRGRELPIYFVGGADGHFDENDYIEFYGTPNELTYQQYSPTYHNDRWTDDNVYWLSWGNGQPGLRLGDEDAAYHSDWPPQNQTTVSRVRASFHFEKDTKFERLGHSGEQFSGQMEQYGPLAVNQDQFFWGSQIDGLTSRDFVVGLPAPDTRSPGGVIVRAALQGFSWPDVGTLGQHRALVYINGKTAPGLAVGKVSESDGNTAWVGQTAVILASKPVDSTLTGILTSDLLSGGNTISVSLPGDGLSGPNDKIYANWFEVEYDRQMRASGGIFQFTFDKARGDTFIYDVRGFQNRNIEVWKLGHSRLTNFTLRRVTVADEGTTWAARFQLISDGVHNMLIFDDRYAKRPAAILPETSTRDLRQMTGAEYLLIYHDQFADDPLSQPWLLRLDSLRRASFNGSADTIRLSTIYEQFSGGVATPVAIHDFLQYAYEHWPVRPTHACLVGDGLMEIRSYTQTGNLISSLYPLTMDFGAAAADMLFGCVSGPPWDILPDIAVGRISCRAPIEFQTYVEKLVRFQDPAQRAYNNLYHSVALFVSDEHDNRFNFDRDYSEPSVGLLPEAVNVKRIYLDSLSGGGQTVLRDALRRGALFVTYNGHGGGGVWSGTELMSVPGVSLLRNAGAYPFISNFTCFVGAFDDRDQAAVLGEAFLFARNAGGDPVGGIGVYSSTGPGWAIAGKLMQYSLFNFCTVPPGLTMGEIVQQNKIRFWSAYTATTLQVDPPFSMMMMMALLGDPGARMPLPPALPNIAANSAVVSRGDSLQVSGVLPWMPAANGTDLYLAPYNDHVITFESGGAYTLRTKLPALDLDDLDPVQVFDSVFSVKMLIPPGFLAHDGHVVVYASDPGIAGIRAPQDGIASLPIYLSDSLANFHAQQITVLPDDYIYSDSTFQVEATMLYNRTIERVRARGSYRPAQGPVQIDSVEMAQVRTGVWRTPALGAYDVNGATYHMQFFALPAGAEDFLATEEFTLPLEGLSDVRISRVQDGFTPPGPRPGKQPLYRVPVFFQRANNSVAVPGLDVRLTAVHDTTILIPRPGLPDSVSFAPADSFVSTVTVPDLGAYTSRFEVWIPTRFRPMSYRVFLELDPDHRIRETTRSNDTLTQFITLPNLFPATALEGTTLPRSGVAPPMAHTFFRPGQKDTLQLTLPPGALPVDSTTLIYVGPDTVSTAELTTLAPAGLSAPDNNVPALSYRVLLADSSDGLANGATAHVVMTFAGISDTAHVQSMALFEKRSAADGWRKLGNQTIERIHRDTTFVPGVGFRYTYSGRLAGEAHDLGRLALFRFQDTQGPVIAFSAGGLHFTRGSLLPRHPEIWINLSDLNGIDRAPGKFRAVLDNDTIPDIEFAWSDSLQSSGSMSAVFRPDLATGHHVLSVWATDNTGISDSASTEFDVRGDFNIEWAINYPNPFRRATTISYLLSDVTTDFVEVKIYTVSGRFIRTLREADRAVANYREIPWDGTDDRHEEVANGVYFARITARQGKQKVEKIVKLAKVR